MLRSFQYTENSYLDLNLQNTALYEQEQLIVKEFVCHNSVNVKYYGSCPVCKSGNGELFYKKWHVPYLRCGHCNSIFVSCEDSLLKRYHEYEKLNAFRRSSYYQDIAENMRYNVWGEFINWFRMRTFRFLNERDKLKCIDVGNRYQGYITLLKETGIFQQYDVRDSIATNDSFCVADGQADVVLYLDQLQGVARPKDKLLQLNSFLRPGGLLYISSRAGTGFDILTLQEHNKKIYPYEHILLPSADGLVQLLNVCGFEALEITTPGVLDVKYVLESKELIKDREFFVSYLLDKSDEVIIQEFQRFLQKSGLSSFLCVIARKTNGKEHGKDESV